MIEVIQAGDLRFSNEEEKALNLLLERHGGTYEGRPQFKLSWAAEDNKGLAKKHTISCPKCDPMDWDCSCPVADITKVPLCFNRFQHCYHILALGDVPRQNNAILDHFERQEDTRFRYDCILHFASNDIPTTPAELRVKLVEYIVPALKMSMKSLNLARHGTEALLQQERLKRANARKEAEERQDARYKDFCTDLVNETVPASQPKVGYGQKSRLADVTASDIERGYFKKEDLLGH